MASLAAARASVLAANRWRLVQPFLLAAWLTVLLLGLVSVRPEWFTAADPYRLDPIHRLLPPGAEYPLGTDEMGRSIYARIVYGARLTVSLALLTVALAATVGTLIGVIAAYYGRWVDEVAMRVTDVFLAFPPLILAMAIVASLGQSLFNSMLGLSGVWWAQYARFVRAQVMDVKVREFVVGAQATGVGRLRLLIRHVLPNAVTPVLVKASVDIGSTMLMLAGLSFMGLGAKPPIPEWGAMITTGRTYFLDYWWVPTFPGLAIFVSVVVFNIIGDWVRDITDPRSASRASRG